jgi:hypothetical protein
VPQSTQCPKCWGGTSRWRRTGWAGLQCSGWNSCTRWPHINWSTPRIIPLVWIKYLSDLLLQFVQPQTLEVVLLECRVEPLPENSEPSLGLLQIEGDLVDLSLVGLEVLPHGLLPSTQCGAVCQIGWRIRKQENHPLCDEFLFIFEDFIRIK